MDLIKKNILNIALAYLLFPVYIFIFGFLNPLTIIVMLAILAFCLLGWIKNEGLEANNYKSKAVYIVVSIVAVTLWCVFSGIGSFSFQNTDFLVRNAVLRDLINFKWPVVFDFSMTAEDIRAYFNLNEPVEFIYYFAYWLPAGMFGKIFGERAADYFLLIWTIAGILIVIALINTFCKKQSVATVVFLILYSGLDYIAWIGNSETGIIDAKQLEWWSEFMQYSSNTTALYWVFNQAVPCWIITALIMNLKKTGSKIFVASLSFWYSPFVTIGAVPIVAYFLIKEYVDARRDNKSVKGFLGENRFWAEILWCVAELAVVGSFYLSAESSISMNGLVWKLHDIPFIKYLGIYLAFIVLELGLYFVILFKNNRHSSLFWLLYIELAIIPLYQMAPTNEWCTRASFMPLFILLIMVVNHFANEVDYKTLLDFKREKKLVIKSSIAAVLFAILFSISAITPFHEIYRSVYYTIEAGGVLPEDTIVYSIGNPVSPLGASVCNDQYYAKGYKNKTFYKFFGKK